MSGDDFSALQALAADNARLCEIVIKADELLKAAETHDASFRPEVTPSRERAGLKAALEAYKVVRQGT